MPGVTNKILSRYVRKVFLGYKEGGKYFHGKASWNIPATYPQ